MIPRSLHFIWIGPRPIPEAWVAAWRAMHPSWQVTIWREDDIAALDIPRRDVYDGFMRDGIWHGAADLARVAILDAVGGVYVDIDSRPLRSLDEGSFMGDGFFAAYEPPNPYLPGRVANGTIGSEAGHPVLKTYRRLLDELTTFDEPWNTCGGTALTEAMALNDCSPLPARTFYPRSWSGKPVAGHDRPFMEHFWSTTNRTYPVRAVVLVPRRAGDPVRDANWAWCRRIWEQQGWPIFEGHHDEPGLFNASKARNAAAANAGDWDVAIFADADTVPWDWRPVRTAVQLAAQTGHFIRPFRSYVMLDEDASREFMASGIVPRHGARRLGESAYGGIHLVPRRLWDESGGYDERFLGWGSEDAAFQFACQVLGGYRALPGTVYHLWHPMQPRDQATPQFQANIALGARYRAIHDRAKMRALIAERDGRPPRSPQVGAVVITNGRRDCIAQTIPSLEQMAGPFAARVICDDSGDPAYEAWLRRSFPGWVVKAHPHFGHARAVRFAMNEAAGMDVDWVMWSEDDLVYQRPIEIPKVIHVMETQPDVKQMVFKRQAWFPSEIEAGGMIERFDPTLFVERDGWIEHRQFFSLQPHLIRRDLVALIRRQWPQVSNSEHLFSLRLFRDKRARCGIWGSKNEPPLVEHIGLARTGSGY